MKKMMAAKGGECSTMGKDSECSTMGTADCPSMGKTEGCEDSKSCDSEDGEVCMEEENCDGDCEGGACNKADAAAKYLPKKDAPEGSCCEEGKEATPAAPAKKYVSLPIRQTAATSRGRRRFSWNQA